MSTTRITRPSNVFGRFQAGFEDVVSKRCASRIATLLEGVMEHRSIFVVGFLGFCVLSGGLVFFLGRDFFPPGGCRAIPACTCAAAPDCELRRRRGW